MNNDLDSVEYKVLEELYKLEEKSSDTQIYLDPFSKFDCLSDLLDNQKFYDDYINILLSLSKAGCIDLDISSDFDGGLKNIKMKEFLMENEIEDIDVEELKLTYEGRKACRIYLENQLKTTIDTQSGINKEELLMLVSEVRSALDALDKKNDADTDRVEVKEGILKKALKHVSGNMEIYGGIIRYIGGVAIGA